jgi:uncharacterized pyridoxamine 5'-phosphate oxidase family protein
VPLASRDLKFLQANPTAAMITIGTDGIPKVARVSVAMIDGRLWSSATEDRVRTRRLRKDPRCTLYVHDPHFGWLTLETTVTILERPYALSMNVRLFRLLQGRPKGMMDWFGGQLTEEEFLQKMVEEKRIKFEFEVHRSYGQHMGYE